MQDFESMYRDFSDDELTELLALQWDDFTCEAQAALASVAEERGISERDVRDYRVRAFSGKAVSDYCSECSMVVQLDNESLSTGSFVCPECGMKQKVFFSLLEESGEGKNRIISTDSSSCPERDGAVTSDLRKIIGIVSTFGWIGSSVVLWFFYLAALTDWLGYFGTVLAFIVAPGVAVFPVVYWIVEGHFPVLYFALMGVSLVFLCLGAAVSED